MTTFVIGHGGGFWCALNGGSSRATLMLTPAPWSEIRSAHNTWQLGGVLGVHVSKPTTFAVQIGGSAPIAPRVVGQVRPHDVVITQYVGRRIVGRASIPWRPGHGADLVLTFDRGPTEAPTVLGSRVI